MIRVVIIEDEVNSQEFLKAILDEHYSGIDVVGVADSVRSGIAAINDYRPDVVFLDIEIQGGTGFDILNGFDQPQFKVIFVTGYDHYALKAIKCSALDYILKPINIEELDLAIKKISSNSQQAQSLSFLQQQVAKNQEDYDQFVISDNDGYTIIKFDDLLFIKADGTYVTFYLQNRVKCIVANTLQFYESILPETLFSRIHKSYLVNLKKVSSIDSGRGGNLQMSEGYELPIAYRRKTRLLKQMKDFRL